MPLRKYLSLGKRWVLERCNLLLKAVFSRLPIQNRVFFYSIRADGKLLENSQCVYDALGNVQKVVVARMLPHPGAAQAENLLLSFDQPCDRHR